MCHSHFTRATEQIFVTGRLQQNATSQAEWTHKWRQVAVCVSGGTVDLHVDGELLVSMSALVTSRTDMLQSGDVIRVEGGSGFYQFYCFYYTNLH